MADIQLSGKKRQIRDFIESCLRERGYPPSVREIGEADDRLYEVTSAVEGRTLAAALHDRRPLPAQVRLDVGVLGEQRRDVLEREPQPPVHHDVPEALQVVGGVDPVARGRPVRMDQPDLVVVVQRADAHAGQLGDASHREVFVHGSDYAA